ncbi:hypothetical protein K439DRAFT_1624383 [Ramaria rubella]|nr:hypothetical protein K439DRAFT_1624383 [Ramaria rubella]
MHKQIPDPIAQNLAQNRLRTKRYTEGGSETLPSHILELQKLREVCGGLGLSILDSEFAGIITLSMPSPFWDPVVGLLGGTLDSKVVISRLTTKWSRRQGLTSTGKESNIGFQMGGRMSFRCENCNKSGDTKSRCWAKGGDQEGQYPEWFKGKQDSRSPNIVKTMTDSRIIWACGLKGSPDLWVADSAATVHVIPNQEDFVPTKNSRNIK